MSTTHASTTDVTIDEEDMPLLFMDDLPSNFQQSAQLAAVATFMADSDDDDGCDDAYKSGYTSKHRHGQQVKHMRKSRQHEPYDKPVKNDKKSESRRKARKANTMDTKELQLFLSMFHISSK
ncbi:uncharacterized protein PHALS_04622 [Plasmopara halstedii]|uniref:Uncharacterized protein n=1 Tax=Plasmopara halstedii TaxID=4781 RepID=A0A0P1AA08_PLAHL|nr:uncharacterized protein PHALS_04622 [Plasmopara halstedii]CEG37174.1 hypothetical protein PHALS_04622 [Plasmopara halstedii]|eukprot:XP_024573543.1 hypothetical protein PHALS_04622 [Plasmopara halstedii]